MISASYSVKEFAAPHSSFCIFLNWHYISFCKSWILRVVIFFSFALSLCWCKLLASCSISSLFCKSPYLVGFCAAWVLHLRIAGWVLNLWLRYQTYCVLFGCFQFVSSSPLSLFLFLSLVLWKLLKELCLVSWAWVYFLQLVLYMLWRITAMGCSFIFSSWFFLHNVVTRLRLNTWTWSSNFLLYQLALPN